jgi:hypothetical protein
MAITSRLVALLQGNLMVQFMQNNKDTAPHVSHSLHHLQSSVCICVPWMFLCVSMHAKQST